MEHRAEQALKQFQVGGLTLMHRLGRLVSRFPRKFLAEVSKTEAARRLRAHLTERTDAAART